MILAAVFNGCETWSLTLMEERKTMFFENRVLRRIFGTKRDEVTAEWRRLYTEELCALYSSLNIIWVIKSRRLRWEENVAHTEERRGEYRVLVGRSEEETEDLGGVVDKY
jgi:hypothetical protein